MKQFPHIISRLYREPLLITPRRHAALCQLVEARMAGPMPAQVEPEDPEDETEDVCLGNTAIIKVEGTIVRYPEDIAMSECGCSMEALGDAIDAAEADSNIKRIVFDFRTPGGTVTGVPEMARKIFGCTKETVAWTASECCSAGMWLASQCEKFYASPSASVGSVGVYTLCLDLSRALEQEGTKINAIAAGKYKLLGAYWKPLTDEEKDIIQKQVDSTYADFLAAMDSRGRVVDDKYYGNGLVFDGEEAARLGMVDGCFDDLPEMLDALES